MFKNLNDFLQGKAPLELDKSGEPTSRELQVASVALLSAAAHVDQKVSNIELTRVLGSLFHEFGLHDAEGVELLEIAEFLIRERKRLDEFFTVLNGSFSTAQRQHLLSLVWKVLTIDGVVEKSELTFSAELRSKLNLTLEQAVAAQQRAKDIHFVMPAVSASEEEE